jgi:hypothetical protein
MQKTRFSCGFDFIFERLANQPSNFLPDKKFLPFLVEQNLAQKREKFCAMQLLPP